MKVYIHFFILGILFIIISSLVNNYNINEFIGVTGLFLVISSLLFYLKDKIKSNNLKKGIYFISFFWWTLYLYFGFLGFAGNPFYFSVYFMINYLFLYLLNIDFKKFLD